MKSTNNYSFSQVPQVNIPRSAFQRDNGYKTTMNTGDLVPVYVDEILPGDTFSISPTLFTRLATPIAPIMDNMYLDIQWFFVPNRLVWENWQRFNGEQDNPDDSTDYIMPTVNPITPQVQSIYDYMGLPINVTLKDIVSLPFRAYNLIFNEWYRDQNLMDSVPVNKGDGPDDPNDYIILTRCKQHDYFTSALPWLQKGKTVDLPIGGQASIIDPTPANGYFLGSPSPLLAGIEMNPGGQPEITDYVTGANAVTIATGGGHKAIAGFGRAGTNETTVWAGNLSDVLSKNAYADLSTASAATINSLRQAFQIQRLLERDARGGTRYTEILRSHFGVISPDARLQRPEFLGGGSTRININPVAQTSSSDGSTPQGNLAAYGQATLHNGGVSKSFTEHGYIIGIASIRADLTYQQGINRMWFRKTRWDHFWPALAHLGEQAILNKEIYVDGTAADEDVFGYQERYAEYRYKPSLITGKFRSTYAQPLDFWHLAQKFENRPALNAEFIQTQVPIERAIAVTNEPQFIVDCYFHTRCVRPMPMYGVPGLIDHF